MGRIAIVGAGIGGLCAGRAVAVAGQEPVVLERSQTDTAVGAGLLLWPNAVLALDELGHGGAVRAAAASAGRTVISARSGATLATIDAEALGRAAGAPLLLIERAILHRILGCDLAVRTGAEVAEVRDGELILAGGERVQADAIIGAEASWSAAPPCRRAVPTGFTRRRARSSMRARRSTRWKLTDGRDRYRRLSTRPIPPPCWSTASARSPRHAPGLGARPRS